MRTRVTVILTAFLAALIAAPAALWASDRFEDVPSDSPFHDEINAIAAAGVTEGCTAERYCPDQPVERDQMAAFLSRLGALQEGMEPVANAATVQGLQVFAEHVSLGVDNPEGNEEECVPTTSSLGEQLEFPAYTVTYQLFAAPETGGQLNSDVNVSLRTTGEVPEPGRHLVCFTRVDGEPLQDGVYSLYRQETYDPDYEPADALSNR